MNSLDILFHGALDKCPICGGRLEWTGTKYACRGDYSEWSTCTFSTKDPPRREEPIEIPESIQNKAVSDVSLNPYLRSHFAIIDCNNDGGFAF